MYIAGFILMVTLIFGGLTLTQFLFYKMNGRFLWRAFVPAAVRLTILPNDKVELDCYDVLTEYASAMLFGSGLVLPIIALNYMGFVHFW